MAFKIGDSHLELILMLIEKLPIGVLIKHGEKTVLKNEILTKIMSEQILDLDENTISRLNFNDDNEMQLFGTNIKVRFEEVVVNDINYQIYYFYFPAISQFSESDTTETPFFKEMLDIADVCLVMVDNEGYVQFLSSAFANILGVDQQSSIGKHVTDVIDNTRMHLVVSSGNNEISELQKIKNDYIIASRFPVIKDGKIVGAVGKVLVNNMDQLNSLKKRLHYLNNEIKRNRGIINARNNAYYTFDHIIGNSRSLKNVIESGKKVAKTDSNVLILGDSGTGKELFAHSIHNASRRSVGAFVKVNCGAIPPELIESELFGYEEGSFTGAKKGGKTGKFEVADGGTIFLDEIGELPLHLQVKLLRVLQEKEIERIGGNGTIPVDIRVIAATNRDLKKMVENGKFRIDLYYRLKVMELNIPSLKERQTDVILLANYFIEKYEKLMNKKIKGMSSSTVQRLSRYNWPGNIRELENTIERALNIVDDNTYIQPEHLPAEIFSGSSVTSIRTLEETMEETERNTILNCLILMNGNKSQTAERLGISRTTLYEKMKKYELD